MGRRAEPRHVQAGVLPPPGIEAEATAGDRETPFQQRGERAVAAHSRAERRIVVAAAAHLLDEAHDVTRAKRVMHVEPFAKQRRHFMRQPEQHPARALRTPGGRDYDSTFGTRMRGNGTLALLLEKRFAIACRRLGLDRGREHTGLDVSRFRPPRSDGAARQGELFA